MIVAVLHEFEVSRVVACALDLCGHTSLHSTCLLIALLQHDPVAARRERGGGRGEAALYNIQSCYSRNWKERGSVFDYILSLW